MESNLPAAIAVAFVALITSVILLRPRASQTQRGELQRAKQRNNIEIVPPQSTALSRALTEAFPDRVINALEERDMFKEELSHHWAQQECEVVPSCIFKPGSANELCKAITIIKQAYHNSISKNNQVPTSGLFAVRSGGHSPVSGAASIKDGALIDLGLLRRVEPSKDQSRVFIGAGSKWCHVSRVLDEMGLAVVGGRNSAVGVGGLILGGGLSFFSPRFGLVCSNVLSYEVVLANGSIVTASAEQHPDLWRALKGGSNNFGIVTGFTVRSFPSTKIWSGFLYMPSFESTRVLAAFHDFVNRVESDKSKKTYDENAAGPILSFSYIQQLGMQAIAANIVHTSPPLSKQWPNCWKNSMFSSLWRIWSTCKLQTLTSATDELNALNPPGRRQVFATTTVKNELETLSVAHSAYVNAIAELRSANVKGLLWTLVLQPLLPSWVHKGDTNPMGLHDVHEPLVIVSFTVNWDDRRHDQLVHSMTRRTVEQIEKAALSRDTSHPWRYLNYCGGWQKPFEGYGEANYTFLKDVSRKYDPDGLFQRGCVGGFKLGMALSGHDELGGYNQ